MTCRALSLALAIGMVLPAGTPAAQTTRLPGGTTAAQASGRTATVLGTVWDGDTRPIANARVRLRDTVSGRVEATTTTNAAGEFVFQGVGGAGARTGGATYVTELVDGRGNVVAVGESFWIAPGDTAVTFIRLRPRGRGPLGGLWGNAAVAAIAAAAGAAVAAADECDCGPLSPEG